MDSSTNIWCTNAVCSSGWHHTSSQQTRHHQTPANHQNLTMLHQRGWLHHMTGLGTLAAAQAHGTKAAAIALCQLLDSCTTHPDVNIQYTASNIIMYICSDAFYQSQSKSCSHMGGHFLFSDCITNQTKPPTKQPTPNAAVCTVSCILQNGMSSATENKFASSFYNAPKGVTLCTVLIEMNHPNQQHQSKQTAQQQPKLPMTRSTNTNQRLWAWISTGSKIGYTRTNFVYTSIQMMKIWLIILPTIIWLPITVSRNKSTYMLQNRCKCTKRL